MKSISNRLGVGFQFVGFFVNRIIELFALHRFNFLDRIWVRNYFTYKYLHERDNIKWLVNNKETLSVSLDVGAGFGFYSKQISKINENSKVFSFEPDPVNYRRTIRTLSFEIEKSQVKVYNLAIAEKTSKLYLWRDVYNPANHQIKFDSKDHLEVQGTSIDIFCSDFSIIPTFIKIDVQGHEKYVLKGAREILSKTRPTILIEFDPKADAKNQTECWSFLIDMNYSAYRIKKDGTLTPIRSIPQEDNYFDLVFKPK